MRSVSSATNRMGWSGGHISQPTPPVSSPTLPSLPHPRFGTCPHMCANSSDSRQWEQSRGHISRLFSRTQAGRGHISAQPSPPHRRSARSLAEVAHPELPPHQTAKLRGNSHQRVVSAASSSHAVCPPLQLLGCANCASQRPKVARPGLDRGMSPSDQARCEPEPGQAPTP